MSRPWRQGASMAFPALPFLRLSFDYTINLSGLRFLFVPFPLVASHSFSFSPPLFFFLRLIIRDKVFQFTGRYLYLI